MIYQEQYDKLMKHAECFEPWAEMQKRMNVMDKATQAQLDFIKMIEEFVDEKFKGTNKEDARSYIDRNIEQFKLNSQSNWALINGY